MKKTQEPDDMPPLTPEQEAEILALHDEPVYEPGHYLVDWPRLQNLRKASVIETDDLYEWYAQQE